MNDSNWLGRIRGLVPQRERNTDTEHTVEARNGSRRGIVVLVVGLLAVATIATGFFAARQAKSPSASLPGLFAASPTATTAAASEARALRGFGGGEGTTEASANVPEQVQEGQNWDRMIIRTATLQLRVKDVATSMDEIRSLVGGHAGYVTGSQSRQEGDYTVGTMTVQVPAAQFDSAISQLRKLGLKVLDENVTTSDVTEEYTDLNSQLRNLQATESRILALMGRAEAINDIMTLDRELRGIQGEIERITGRINFLGKRAEMSTITISLYPEAIEVQPTPGPAEAWDPVRIAGEAWESSLELLANVGTMVITVVVFLWWLLPVAVVASIFLRRSRRPMPQAPTASAAE